MAFLAEVARSKGSLSTPLVFKLFNTHVGFVHLAELARNDTCAIVLERTNIATRWCSYVIAERTRDWSGAHRHNCTPEWWDAADNATMNATYDREHPPREYRQFESAHREWYDRVRRIFQRHMYLTFDSIVSRRADAIEAVGTFCGAGERRVTT